jgi:acyl carrier protein
VIEEIKNRYRAAFIRTFDLDQESALDELKYQGIKQWDSLGHMALMAALEDEFKIEMDVDDIIDFTSFSDGFVIIEKYLKDS